MLAEQGGGCAVCGDPPGRTALHVDHCHDTGLVRGLLCFRCNSAIGNLRDDPDIIAAALAYVTRPAQRQPVAYAPVTLPMFSPHDDPGPSFAELLRRVGLEPPAPSSSLDGVLTITHATTVVAIRYADGVVMAGDRRATSGNLISHRAMEKVFAADRHSGVAIAGAAGPAMDMVKLFQLQLEHYEKVEASALSLDGKANQLSTMVRIQPARSHAGPGRGAAVRRLRPGPRRPDACSSTT